MIHNGGPQLRSKLSSLYRRCRCYTCLAHPDHAVLLKRPITPPAKIAFNQVATFAFCTSVICTGAVLDTKLKRRRRHSLDGAIEQAEQELAAGQKRQSSRLAALGLQALGEEELDILASGKSSDRDSGGTVEQHQRWLLIGRGAKSRRQHHGIPTNLDGSVVSLSVLRYSALPHAQFGNQSADNEQLTERRTEELLGMSQQSPLPPDLVSSPNSIYADTEAQLKTEYTQKKLVRTEYSIALLATEMLLALGGHEAGRVDDLNSRRIFLKSRLREVTAGPSQVVQVERLDYPRYEPEVEGANAILKQLNSAIGSLFGQFHQGRITTRVLVEKLNYNLLVSPVPPNKIVYSNMIKELSRANAHPLADLVVRSMQRSSIRHDEISVSTILTHYRRTNNRSKFRRFHELLEGKHGGLMLAKPAVLPDDPSNAQPRWLSLANSRGKTASLVYWNDSIWRELVAGYLKFDDFSTATRLLEGMKSAGIEPDLVSMNHLMAYCLRRQDFDRALRVWANIEEEHLRKTRGSRLAHGSPEHQCYRTALRVCKSSGRSADFKRIYQQALESGLWVHALLPAFVPNALARPSSYQALLRRRTSVIEGKLSLLTEDFAQMSLQVLECEKLLAPIPIRNSIARLPSDAQERDLKLPHEAEDPVYRLSSSPQEGKDVEESTRRRASSGSKRAADLWRPAVASKLPVDYTANMEEGYSYAMA